jgi:hypothetical protein
MQKTSQNPGEPAAGKEKNMNSEARFWDKRAEKYSQEPVRDQGGR